MKTSPDRSPFSLARSVLTSFLIGGALGGLPIYFVLYLFFGPGTYIPAFLLGGLVGLIYDARDGFPNS